jgi:hypothetical protein
MSGQTFGCRQCFYDRRRRDADIVQLLIRFRNLRGRCYNPKNPNWRLYGGRGITIHKEWLSDPERFAIYIKSLPGFSLDKQFDRIDNDKGYEPGNIRLVGSADNNRNKRTNRKVEFNGEQLCITDFVKKYTRLTWSYAYRLIAQGHSLEELARWEPAYRSHKGLRRGECRAKK